MSQQKRPNLCEKLYNCAIGDHADTPFIRCVVDTHFGELEFIHTLDQVPEEMRENIRVGSVVSGTCILSADVALHEYENGIVKDHEHNLRALRYAHHDENTESHPEEG